MRIPPALSCIPALLIGAAQLAAQSGVIRAGKAVHGVNVMPSLPADARRGFWIGAGLGAGAGSMHCGICENERDQGTSGYLRAGFTLNRKVLLGLEGSGWQRSGEEGRRRILALTAGAWWYPSERHGYFLRGGAGVSRWRASQEADAIVSGAVALVLGVGYEVRVNPGLSVAPYLNAMASSSGALWLESRDDVSFERRRLPSGGHALLFQLGVGLTSH